MKRERSSDCPFGLRFLFSVFSFLIAIIISQCTSNTSGQISDQNEDQNQNEQPPSECKSPTDCINSNGEAPQGCLWECQQGECKMVGSCDQNPNDGMNDDDSVDDTEPSCLSEILGVMQEGLCSCECLDCDCNQIDCRCDLTCYQVPPPPGCVVEVDENGQIVIDGNQLENCVLECETESDLIQEMPCILNDCIIPPNDINIDIQPQTQEIESSAQLELEREIRPVDVLFVVDNSFSMADDQMASFCAMDKFLDAASANGANVDVGAINTDLANPTTGLLEITNPGSCQLPLVDCQCRADGSLPPKPAGWEACDFSQGGDWIDASKPDNWNILKQTIVQGEERLCGCEGGLQQAFRLFAQMEIDGKFSGTYETVVISDEDANGDDGTTQHLCPFNGSLDQDLQNKLKNTSLGFNPPTPVGTQKSCKDDLAAFYMYYFQSRGIMVHGLIYDQACGGTTTEKTGEIYEKVIEATNGHQASICDCNAFQPFMEDVGNTTSDMSTQLCVDDPTEAEKIESGLDVVTLYYTEGGVEEIVARSASDGWRFDPNTDCFILSGSWEKKMGSFRVDYKGGPTQVVFEDVEVCLDSFNPIVSSIVVTCDVNGQDEKVPQSDSNGWSLQTVGGKKCLVFTGSWREQQLQCSLEYRE